MTAVVNGGEQLPSCSLTFAMKIGLILESVRVDLAAYGGRLTTEMLRDVAFAFLDRNYPEHGFYQLQDRIILFLHDASNPNILGLIDGITTTADDVKEKSLIEVVLTADTTPEELEIRPHNLHVYSYRYPHFCDFCGEMLFGLVKQGLKCEGCGLNYHKRCAYKIPKNCSNSRQSQSYRLLSPTEAVGSRTSSVVQHSPSSAQVAGAVPSLTAASAVEPSLRSKSWAGDGGEVMWMERKCGSSLRVPHTFVIRNYRKPTVCQHCKRLLKGLFRQGLQCKDCKFNCHKKCAALVPKDCQGYAGYISTPSMAVDLAADESSTVNGGDYAGDRESRASSADLSELTGATLTSEADDRESYLTEDDELDTPVKPYLSTVHSCNIPLQRVVQSFKHTKGKTGLVLREGWMVHYTNRDNIRRRHYWKLDAKSIILYKDDTTSHYFKEIVLSDISLVKSNNFATPAFDSSSSLHGPSNYVFEVHCGETVYYVGENPAVGAPVDMYSRRNVVCSMRSGSGLEKAQSWETAIRQARLPLATKPSVNEPSSSAVTVASHQSGSIGSSDDDVYSYEDVDISELYHIYPDDVLGSGQFGIVYGARSKQTSRAVAIKVIDKQRFPTKQEAQLKNEVSILHEVHHPGVVRLEKMFETSERIFVVMEKLEGDMLEMILSSTRGRLTERITRFLVSQILLALKYLHSRHIVHCDLKPENVLLSSETAFPQVKLCDFGFARIIGDQSFRRSVVGTPAYLAPEVLKSKGYNRSLDMWSVGVIIYVSLSGTFPFNEDEEIKEQIQNAEFMFPENLWSEVSSDARELISRLLQIKMRQRFTADKSLAHNWLQNYRCWCDLRKLEEQVGERFLTHESDDGRWNQYRKDHSLPDWPLYGHTDITEDDRFNFNKSPIMPPSPS